MWKADYGKEPFDLRLTVLCTMKRLPVLVGGVVLLTMVLGGAYYVKNVVLGPEKTYMATSFYKVDFDDPEWAHYGTYINETTWNSYMHVEAFLSRVEKYLSENGEGITVTRQEIEDALSAKLLSDLRLPSTYVVTESPAKTEAIAHAVEQTMVNDFVEIAAAPIRSIQVVDPGVAEEVKPDLRMKRAFVLAGVFSFFAVFGIYLLTEIGSDSIWLPVTLKTRYGLTPVGTIESKVLPENLKFLFGDMEKVAVCPVSEQIAMDQVIDRLKKVTENTVTWEPEKVPVKAPEEMSAVRDADGCLLVVKAGKNVGKPLEEVLNFLGTQKIQVTGVLLWEADERLIRSYYCFAKKDC